MIGMKVETLWADTPSQQTNGGLVAAAEQDTAVSWRRKGCCDDKSSWHVVMNCIEGRKSLVPNMMEWALIVHILMPRGLLPAKLE